MLLGYTITLKLNIFELLTIADVRDNKKNTIYQQNFLQVGDSEQLQPKNLMST